MAISIAPRAGVSAINPMPKALIALLGLGACWVIGAVRAADYPWFSFYGGIAVADVKTALLVIDYVPGDLLEAPVMTLSRDGETFKLCQQRRVAPGATTLDTQWVPNLPALPTGHYRIEYSWSDTVGSGPLNPCIGKVERNFVVYEPAPARAVEYYNSSLDHYFITADPEEMNVLDTAQIPGWTRTGEAWPAYANANEPSDDLVPVCRFYGVPAAGINSHFYSADSSDCQYVLQHWPDQWLLETLSAVMFVPTTPSNRCPSGTRPAWRLYNDAKNNNPNHRYTVDQDIVDQMTQRGWILEKAAWCVFGGPPVTWSPGAP